MDRESTENSRPRRCHEVLGFTWSGKNYIVLNVMINKVQSYPPPKNVKEERASVGIRGLGRTLIPDLA